MDASQALPGHQLRNEWHLFNSCLLARLEQQLPSASLMGQTLHVSCGLDDTPHICNSDCSFTAKRNSLGGGGGVFR